MECSFELKRNSIDRHQFKTSSPQANRRLDFRERFRHEKANFSHAEKMKDFSPQSTGSNQKQRRHRSKREDELVKYMSKVPNYLERGRDPQEKVLSVGVLDWGRLQRWQKHTPHRSCSSSLDSSNMSSPSTDASSSSYSGQDYSCSSASQKMHRRSLQFQLMSSPLERHSQVVRSSNRASTGTYHDLKYAWGNTLNKPSVQKHQEINPKESKIKVAEPMTDRQSGFLLTGVKYEVASSMKAKMKFQDDQLIKSVDAELVGQGIPGEQKDIPQRNALGVPNLSNSKTISDKKPVERGYSERSKGAACNSDIHHVRQLRRDVDNSKCLRTEQLCPVDAKIDDFLSQRSQSVPRSATTGTCPSRVRNMEYRQSTSAANKLPANEPLAESDLKPKQPPGKVRSTSPFRRLSISMLKMGKTSSSKECSTLSQLRSTNDSAVSGPQNSYGDKPEVTATSRARSSPLRRLLDPILKSKPGNCRSHSESFLKESASRYSVSKPSDGPNYQEITSLEKNNGASLVQALLRVAVKNSQPLFTFAVDKERNILAATMKKLSTSRKEDYSCIYRFFAIQEAKKKNGRWLNNGGKAQNPEFIPNGIAQMKVFGSHFANLRTENHVDRISMREYVLSSVELTQADEQTADFWPTDELAAIVIKISSRMSKSAFINGNRSDVHKDFSEVGLKDHLPEVNVDSNSGKKEQDRAFLNGQGLNASVILPSGVHTIPHKGGPSSLIQRWRSGGSCDCGGWDLGCNLRVFTDQNQLGKKGGPFPACSTANKFELFSQGGVQENQAIFSLVPFKDGVFSVEFNPSLSLLQAFSICIAVLDSKKPCEVSTTSNDLFEDKTSGETVLSQNDTTRASSTTPGEGEVPAKYVSYPPLSPVKRA